MTIFWVFFSLSFPNLELGKSYQSKFSFLGVFFAPEEDGVTSAALYITDLSDIAKKKRKKDKKSVSPLFSATLVFEGFESDFSRKPGL